MNARLKQLHEVGQSIWVDNIRRDMLTGGTLARYINDLSVTGLTSNPTIFEQAISRSTDYDATIRHHIEEGRAPEDVFFAVAMEDITAAADLFRPVYDATGGGDGFVSLEVSPKLADDAPNTIAEAKRLYALAARPNLFIKVPGTAAGLIAIEELIYSGVSINVTLLFSREHYLACADAYMKGIERRVTAGLSPVVPSVASLFVSRWDPASNDRLPAELKEHLGIAISKRTYRAYRALLESARWKRLSAAGARPQRLLWASTGTKNPALPDTYYIEALAAPMTVNTMPESALNGFADHGTVGALLAPDGGDAEDVIARVGRAGVDVDALGAELQIKGRDAFVASFVQLLDRIAAKMDALRGGARASAVS